MERTLLFKDIAIYIGVLLMEQPVECTVPLDIYNTNDPNNME